MPVLTPPPSTTRLLSSYRKAAKELNQTILQADPKKPVVFLRRVVLVDIEGITKDLEKETRVWLEAEVPKQYKEGSFRAISDSKAQELILKRTEFGQIHKEAVEALVEDAYLDFAGGIEGVKRAGREFISDLIKLKINERIVVGSIKGEGVYKIKREVKKLVEDRGFTALIDRGSKRWKIDTYAEMLVRTHIIKANNSGFVNRLLENGLELVEMSSHGSSCPICQQYEGKIFSLTGNDKKHEKAPDLPIHPNCRHSYLPYIEN
jgi:hypothetical protein